MEVFDLHEDIGYYFATGKRPDFDVDEPNRQSDLPKLMRGGVSLVFASIFPVATFYGPEGPGAPTPTGSKALALLMFKSLYLLARRHGVTIVESAADLRRPGLKFLLLMEGADSLEDPYDLYIYYKLGLRAIGITWNIDNRYGASCMSRRDYGLTPEGEELVKLANELGVVIDLAHAGRRTALDAIYASKRPVIISHANAYSVHKSPRNVDDEVLEALKKNGGIIGVTAIPSIIGGSGSVEDLARHVLYIRDSFGVDVLAIGTDALGVDAMAAGLESVDKIPRFLELLKEKGLSDSELEKMAYLNAKRVLEANLR